MANFLISSDEEKKINDMLEDGLDEIRGRGEFTKHLNRGIKKEFVDEKTTNLLGVKDRGLNFNYNCKHNENELSQNEEYITRQVSDQKNNFFNSGESSIKINTSIKSSALRNLLDEIKNDNRFNKYMSSSDDDFEFFKAKKFREEKVDAKETEETCDFRVRKRSPDLMKTNTISTENEERYSFYPNTHTERQFANYDQAQVMTKIKKFNSDDEGANFGEMRFEIKNLQNKIDGMEKKLKNSFISNSNDSMASNTNNSFSYNKTSLIKSRLKNKHCFSENESKYRKPFIAGGININNSRSNSNISKNSDLSKSLSKNNSFVKKAKKPVKKMFKSQNPLLKGKLDYKEKYEKIKENYESIKQSLVKERKNNLNISNKNKNMIKKEENYDKLNTSHEKLKENYNKLRNKYKESELIRKEQSKLIKSMQREIDVLRNGFNEALDKNSDKLIEEYKEIKSSLPHSDNKNKRNMSKSKIKY